MSAPESTCPTHPDDVRQLAVPEQAIDDVSWAPAAAVTRRRAADPRWRVDLDWEPTPAPITPHLTLDVPLELPDAGAPVDRSIWFGIERPLEDVEDQLAGYDPWFDHTWNGDPFAVREFWSVGFRFDSGVQWTMTDITGQVMRFSDVDIGESLEFQFGYQF